MANAFLRTRCFWSHAFNDDNLYITNSMWHVQIHFTVSMQEIELKASGCRYMVHIWSLISVYDRGQITALGRFPYSFREAWEFFKVPSIGLVKIERLGQRLNVPTQGKRVAQTETKPFSFTALGSDPQPRIEHGPHWWETDLLTTRPPEHPEFL